MAKPKKQEVLSAREMRERVEQKWWEGTSAAPATEPYIPIDTQFYTRPAPPSPPLYKNPAFYGALGMGTLTVGGILYLYQRSVAIKSVRDSSPSPVAKPPAEAVAKAISADEPLRVSFTEALKNGLEFRSQLERIFEAPLGDYRESGWADSRILIDFTDPFNENRNPARPAVALKWFAPKETRENGVVVNVPFEPNLGDPQGSANLLVDYLKRHDCIRLDDDFLVEVDLGRFNTIPFVKIYGAPRKVKMTNERVRNRLRVSTAARPLHYVLTLGAPPNREDRISRGETPVLTFGLRDVGITPYYKDFLARILSGEMNGWVRRGKCYANDAGAPLWCEFERAAILQTAMNRLVKLQADGRISRSGMASWDLDDLLSLLRLTNWNNSSDFRELFSLGSESWIYRSNREFIDLALFFPDFIPEGRQFVHYLGFSEPAEGAAIPCLPPWIASEQEGGQVRGYPKQIGYALFSNPDGRLPSNTEFCR